MPSVTIQDPTNVTKESFRVNGTLVTNNGLSTTILIYWGKISGQSDPYTGNPISWDHSQSIGVKPLGAFTFDVTALDASAIYFVRVVATNTYGVGAAGNKSVATITPTTQRATARAKSRLRSAYKTPLRSRVTQFQPQIQFIAPIGRLAAGNTMRLAKQARVVASFYRPLGSTPYGNSILWTSSDPVALSWLMNDPGNGYGPNLPLTPNSEPSYNIERHWMIMRGLWKIEVALNLLYKNPSLATATAVLYATPYRKNVSGFLSGTRIIHTENLIIGMNAIEVQTELIGSDLWDVLLAIDYGGYYYGGPAYGTHVLDVTMQATKL